MQRYQVFYPNYCNCFHIRRICHNTVIHTPHIWHGVPILRDVILYSNNQRQMQLHYIILCSAFFFARLEFCIIGSVLVKTIVVIRNSLMGATRYIFSMLCHGIYYVGRQYIVRVKGAILYQSTAAAIFSKIGLLKSYRCAKTRTSMNEGEKHI